jgi:phosphatidylglycerophosphate synthase/glycerol-3-phosphate cytidylyltransferase-like family protein
MLLVNGYKYLAALLILAVDFGDFLDGVVARYWFDRKKIEAISNEEESKDTPKISASWIIDHRQKSYGGFIDAVCDKAFVVPIWLISLASVPSSKLFHIAQYVVLWFLIFTEVSSGCIRFRAYYTCNGVAAPSVKGLDFSTSAVKADHIGKAKQTFEMFGTAFFVSSSMKYFGLILLAAAVPLAYESVRRKTKKRTIYVDGTSDNFDHHTLKFWKQAKGLGSKLVVGFSEEKKDMIQLAKACESVDSVLLNAPQGKLTSKYLDQLGVDYVVCGVGQSTGVVSTELIAAKRCLIIVDDKTAKPLESKDVKTE